MRAPWLLAAQILACSTAAAAQNAVALTNADVVDVAAGTLLRRQTIVIRGGRIDQVGPASVVRIPPGSTRIDVPGRFVIPGLWDMHVHLGAGDKDQDALMYYGSLFLAHGVTGVRDAGTVLSRLKALDSLTRTGGLMPRLYYAGEKIGPAAGQSWSLADANAAIAAQTRAGAHYVKLNPGYPDALLRATLGTCHAAGLHCVAHVPAADTSVWLSAPGRGSFEHLFNLTEHVSRIPAPDLFSSSREYATPSVAQRVLYKLRLRRRPDNPRALRVAVRDTTRDRDFFQRVAASGTWFTPTLMLHHALTSPSEILPSAVDATLSLESAPPLRRDTTQAQLARGMWGLWNGLVRAMHRNGVSLLAGTDFFTTHVPGASLHAEMVLLQEAGIPPAAVLRMATSNAARQLRAADTLGLVAAGQLADLVVLRRNPLDDVRHVGEVDMVVTRGILLRRAALDSLTQVARAARHRIRATSR